MRLLPPFAALDPTEVIEPEAPVALSEGATSLEFLQAVYRDPDQPMHRRMRAAVAALPFEHPKLAVVAAVGNGRDFAARMEAAIERSSKLLSHRPLSASG